MPPREQDPDPRIGRLRLLLDLLAAGKVRDFSRQIGRSHSLISQVLSGRRSLTEDLVNAIAGHPRVNEKWLQTGAGDPLVAAVPGPTEYGWAIPVASQLLDGPPSQCPDRLLPTATYVPPVWSSHTLYAISVKDCHLPPGADHAAMLPEDLLLIDTDPARWDDLSVINGRYGIWRCQVPPHLRLDRLTIDQNHGTDVLTVTTPAQIPKQTSARPLRRIVLEPGSRPTAAENPLSLDLSDLRGIVVRLIRDL